MAGPSAQPWAQVVAQPPLAWLPAFSPDLWQYDLFAWGGALSVALMLRGYGKWRWHQAVGIAVMTVPLWFTLLGILATIAPLFGPGITLRPYSRYGLSLITWSKLLEDLGYLGVGFLLYHGGPRGLLATGPRQAAQGLVRLGLPTGRTEGRAALAGLVLFPLLWYATLYAQRLASGVPAINQSDERSVWDNMTLYHAVLLAAAAAFGEELVYRGVLQTGLERLLGRGPGRSHLANLLQAAFFGFAHAGYGSWSHILGPFLFGLLAGYASRRWGILSAIVMHFLINFLIWVGYIARSQPLVAEVASVLLLANIVFTGTVLGWLVWRRMRLPRPVDRM